MIYFFVSYFMKKIGEGGKKVWDLQTLVESEESTTGTNRDTDLFIIHLLHFFVRLPCPVKMAAGNIFLTTLACQMHSSKGERYR